MLSSRSELYLKIVRYSCSHIQPCSQIFQCLIIFMALHSRLEQGSLSLLAANTRASSWQKKRDNNLNYVLTTWSSHCASFQILDRVLMVGFNEGSLMMTLYEQDYEKEDSWRIEKFWTPCYLPRGISE